MEYSPGCAIPYVSRVDAGTVDAVRALGVEVRSSGDLIQRFEAVWDADALASHREASAALHDIKDRAFDLVSRCLRDGRPLTELDVQEAMAGWFDEAGLVSDSRPVVAAQENAGDPHYLPTPDRHRGIGAGEVVLLDLWGKKKDAPDAVYADITWMGYTGAAVPARYADAFRVIRDGRDAAVDLVRGAVEAGRELRGWEVDRAVRDRLGAAGLGDRVRAPDRAQPGPRGPRQRRAPRRFRDPRRAEAAAGHGGDHRARRVLSRTSDFEPRSTSTSERTRRR